LGVQHNKHSRSSTHDPIVSLGIGLYTESETIMLWGTKC